MSFAVEYVQVPMRDGVELATEVWLPVGVESAPTLVMRSPYGKQMLLMHAFPLQPSIFRLVDAGYAVVLQDVRGVFASGGALEPVKNEGDDGEDTIAWVRQQTWCDGEVGMYGVSYLGMTQWAVAARDVEGLRAIAPAITSNDMYAAPWHSDGGALSLQITHGWTAMMVAGEIERSLGSADEEQAAQLWDDFASIAGVLDSPDEHLAHLPLRDQPIFDQHGPWWADFVDHADRDKYWETFGLQRAGKSPQIPALHIAGWFDPFLSTNLNAYAELRDGAESDAVRDGQLLIIGPWDHDYHGGAYADRSFGLMSNAAMLDLSSTYIAFYDAWLRKQPESLAAVPRVQIFVMGIDEWRHADTWPLPGTRYVDHFLGHGSLATAAPLEDGQQRYLFDPMDPVPTLGGRTLLPAATNATGAVDQRAVELRADVVCFSSGVLEEPLEVTGPVRLVLHVSTSAQDTDFTAKLVDVFPDGRAIYLTDGMLRLRYRESLAHPVLAEPGKPYEIEIDLAATSNVFLPGHEIRLEVSSSNFPRYDRNTNSGGVIARDTEDDVVVAENVILHGPSHPSRLVLPIIG